jgi:hypothetical protein
MLQHGRHSFRSQHQGPLRLIVYVIDIIDNIVMFMQKSRHENLLTLVKSISYVRMSKLIKSIEKDTGDRWRCWKGSDNKKRLDD